MNKKTKREFDHISRQAQRALKREEGFDVEFKESLNGLESADLVAFANSLAGGTILIGVKESKTLEGRQKGIVVGCKIGDAEKRKILDKASSCTPPIELNVLVENAASTPFYRIEIPPSRNRPHCTLSGQYSIRGDGRKNALLPTQLLSIFLESEAGRFVEQFRSATRDIEADLTDTKQKVIGEVQGVVLSLKSIHQTLDLVQESVLNELSGVVGSVESMEYSINKSLKNIFASAGEAESYASEAANASTSIMETLGQIEEGIAEAYSKITATLRHVQIQEHRGTHKKIDAVLRHLQIEDPTIIARREVVKGLIKVRWRMAKQKNVTMTREDALSLFSDAFPATPEQMSQWCNDAIAELRAEEMKAVPVAQGVFNTDGTRHA